MQNVIIQIIPGIATGSFVAGLICVVPIVPLIAAYREPEYENLGITNLELEKISDYRNGYINYAQNEEGKKYMQIIGLVLRHKCLLISYFLLLNNLR